MAASVTPRHRWLSIETHHWRAELTHCERVVVHRSRHCALDAAMCTRATRESIAHDRIRSELLLIEGLLLLLERLNLVLQSDLENN